MAIGVAHGRLRWKSDLRRNSARTGQRTRSHESGEGSTHVCDGADALGTHAQSDKWACWAHLQYRCRALPLRAQGIGRDERQMLSSMQMTYTCHRGLENTRIIPRIRLLGSPGGSAVRTTRRRKGLLQGAGRVLFKYVSAPAVAVP